MNLEEHCKENLKRSYHNEKNYERKAVGIGVLAKNKLMRQMIIPSEESKTFESRRTSMEFMRSPSN